MTGPSPLSVALAITRQSRRNVRDDRVAEVLEGAAPSHAAHSSKELVWQRQQRVPTSSSRDQNEHREHVRYAATPPLAHHVPSVTLALQGLNAAIKSPSFLPPVHSTTSPPPAPSQPAWRHLGSRTEAQKVRFPQVSPRSSHRHWHFPSVHLMQPFPPCSTYRPFSQAAPPRTPAWWKFNRPQPQRTCSSCRIPSRRV